MKNILPIVALIVGMFALLFASTDKKDIEYIDKPYVPVDIVIDGELHQLRVDSIVVGESGIPQFYMDSIAHMIECELIIIR